MNIQKIENGAGENALPGAATANASKRKRGATSAKSGNKGTKSKQDQLVALLSKPNGVRVTVISQRLGWQAHTLRAAISGLRKRGYEIVTSKWSTRSILAPRRVALLRLRRRHEPADRGSGGCRYLSL